MVGRVRWWSAIFGILLLIWAVAFAAGLRQPMEVTRTDARGNETVEYRRLRPREQIAVAGGIIVAGVLGALLLAGAVPWTDERVPEERLLAVLGVGLVMVMFASVAAVAWVQAWRSHTVRRPRGGSGTTADPDDGLGADPEDGPDDALVGLLVRLLLSHPVGATFLGAVAAALAVFSATQFAAAWRGDGARLEAVLQWLQPLEALGALLGLSEVSVALILLGIWLIIALFTRNALGAVVTLMLMGGYALVALVVWPLGWLDEWLGFGRGVLSLL
jgi:hypothetical protein